MTRKEQILKNQAFLADKLTAITDKLTQLESKLDQLNNNPRKAQPGTPPPHCRICGSLHIYSKPGFAPNNPMGIGCHNCDRAKHCGYDKTWA